MKKFYLLFGLFLLSFVGYGQQTIDGSIMFDGRVRTYILYVPANYSAETPVPLVLNFHGYGSNAFEQMHYGDFRPIADTAGFIVVQPMGTVDLIGSTHWNVGWGTSSLNDVSFTNALIDSLSAAYNINQDRVYSTGMSNGGFMSYQLACKLSNRIAAIASVTGAMTIGTPASCNPDHPTPVMEIHGTADGTVPYAGNILFESVASGLAYWTNYNETDATPTTTDIDDTDPNDGSTVQHMYYGNGNNGVVVEHYKVNGGAHTWPGTAFGGAGTNHDMDASKEIWRFFSMYDIHGLINTTATTSISSEKTLKLYPNPSRSFMVVERQTDQQAPYIISGVDGQQLKSGILTDAKEQINISGLPTGMYILNTGSEVVRFFKAE